MEAVRPGGTRQKVEAAIAAAVARKVARISSGESRSKRTTCPKHTEGGALRQHGHPRGLGRRRRAKPEAATAALAALASRRAASGAAR